MVRITAPQMTGIQKVRCCDTAVFPSSERIYSREADAALTAVTSATFHQLALSFVLGISDLKGESAQLLTAGGASPSFVSVTA
jgi:hypothetical protein